MHIKSIVLDQEKCEKLGFGPWELAFGSSLELGPLGQTVVLAGENGSGKSRLLKLLENMIKKQMAPDLLSENELKRVTSEGHLNSSIAGLDVKLKAKETAADDAARQKIGAEIAQLQNTVKGHTDNVAKLSKEISAAQFFGEGRRSLVKLVPQKAKLGNPGAHAIDRIEALANQLLIPGNADTENTAPAYMHRVEQKAVAAFRERDGIGEKTLQEQEKDRLHALLKTLLGSEVVIEFKEATRLLFDGQDLSKEILSPGQQVLFQFACILHAQGGSLPECIVVMDEPENHLHPFALQEVIDSLRRSLTRGQLWIATHSVPLIAHLVAEDSDCLWFAEAGKFEHVRKSPERMLASLLGKGDGTSRLHDLTMQPAQYAALNFSAQCLLEPGVAGGNIEDKQTNQIARILEGRFNLSGEKLRILDYGAGKGRLLPTLATYTDAHERFDYYAYDKYPENRDECERKIASFYKDDRPRYLDTLLLPPGIEPFHIVIMCNVLHEIDPDTWLELFGKKGDLDSILSPNGAVLFVEDYGINIGERAHQYGFLLLGGEELRTLFEIGDSDLEAKRFVKVTSTDIGYENRLTAHLVDQQCVTKISTESQGKAIAGLKKRLRGELTAMIKDPVRGETSDKKGLAYARASQLFVNASLWIEGQRVPLGSHPDK